MRVRKRTKKRIQDVLKFQAPFERVKSYASPEQALYKSIIIQAITDATGGNNQEEEKSQKYANEAKLWLFGKSKYFNEVCYKADLLPEQVEKIAKGAILLNKKKQKKSTKALS